MKVTTRESYGVVIVDMEGSLESNTSGDTGDALVGLVKDGNKKILINLAKVDYISSAGLRAILVPAKMLQHDSGELRLCSPNNDVRQVLEISGFTFLLRIDDNEEASMTNFLNVGN